MGHTRLGNLPKTLKWLDLVRRISGSGASVGVLSATSYVEAISAQTLEAGQAALDNAKHDSGVVYAFYLLTQVTLASRSKNWENVLALHGIRLASDSTVFNLPSEIHPAIDRRVNRGSSGATDLSEMAQQYSRRSADEPRRRAHGKSLWWQQRRGPTGCALAFY